MLRVDSRDKTSLLDPLYTTGRGFWIALVVLVAVLAWGITMYIRQLSLGLGQTGMNRPVFWGVYMVNFIFFIGISHAGTLISAFLRVTGAEWRRPITRVAEAITAFALIVGTLQIIVDMGRPDRLLNVVLNGRLQSPILWDVVSVTAYFLGSITYLYLPIIPDAALLRDNFPEGGPRWRKRLYSVLSLGWRGSRIQWVRLEKAIAVMAVLIIPIAVSVHTIISWILATTVQPGWHSTIFGPYFVVGAIFSGIGALFVAMSLVRKVMHLEDYITERQYRYLGMIFITMSAVWMYFTYAEHLTLAAGQQSAEFPVLASKLWGEFSTGFWLMVVLMVMAFWILVAPSLFPEAARRRRVFRPWSAVTFALAAAFSGVVLFRPELLPVPAALEPGEEMRRALWAVFGLSVLMAALGTAAWFKTRIVAASVVSAVFVIIGMWLERWNIIAPTVTHPYLVSYAQYRPTVTEVAETAGSLALFMLLFLIFFKLFPVISVWEVAEGRVIERERAGIHYPMPESSDSRRLPPLGSRREQKPAKEA